MRSTPTIVRPTTRRSSSGCGRRAPSSWRRRTWRSTRWTARAARSAARSATRTTPSASRGCRAPDRRRSVAANLVTCAIGEETVVSIRWPAAVNSLVGLAPTQELVSSDGMMGAGLNMRVGPMCRTVQDAARILDAIAGYDPKDELTAFSVGRTPAQPYAELCRRAAARRRAHRRRARVHEPKAAREGRRGKHRPRRARDRRAAHARRHDRRSRSGGRAVPGAASPR